MNKYFFLNFITNYRILYVIILGSRIASPTRLRLSGGAIAASANRKRAVSWSPYSAESLDLAAVIRASPASLAVRAPSAASTGSYGHLSAGKNTILTTNASAIPYTAVSLDLFVYSWILGAMCCHLYTKKNLLEAMIIYYHNYIINTILFLNYKML